MCTNLKDIDHFLLLLRLKYSTLRPAKKLNELSLLLYDKNPSQNAHLEQSAGPSSAETVVDSTTGAVVPNKPEVSSQSAATTKSAGTTDIPESSTAQKSLTNRLRNWWSSLHFNWWGKGIRKKHNPTTQEAETTCFLKTS